MITHIHYYHSHTGHLPHAAQLLWHKLRRWLLTYRSFTSCSAAAPASIASSWCIHFLEYYFMAVTLPSTSYLVLLKITFCSTAALTLAASSWRIASLAFMSASAVCCGPMVSAVVSRRRTSLCLQTQAFCSPTIYSLQYDVMKWFQQWRAWGTHSYAHMNNRKHSSCKLFERMRLIRKDS